MKSKKIVAVMLAFAVLFLFSGCAVPINLRDRAIVQIMGIDYENDKYKVILQEYLPVNTDKSSGGEETSSEYVVSEGETLFDAIKNAEIKDGNQVFYGQCRLYIIGEDALKKGIGQVTEFMNSNYQLSLNSSVLAANGKAEEILKAKLFSGTAPDISVSRIEGCGKAPDTTVIDILKMMYNLNGTGCLPLISLKGKDEAVIERCIVLKDYKSHIRLNDEETMGLTWINEGISDAVMTAEHNGHKVSVGVVSENTKISMETQKDGGIIVKISVSAKGNVSENGIISSKHVNIGQVEAVEKDIKQTIEKQIDAALKKVVTQGECDLFYLLQRLKKTDNELYLKVKGDNNWLSEIEFQVSADFSVRHSGIQVR